MITPAAQAYRDTESLNNIRTVEELSTVEDAIQKAVKERKYNVTVYQVFCDVVLKKLMQAGYETLVTPPSQQESGSLKISWAHVQYSTQNPPGAE